MLCYLYICRSLMIEQENKEKEKEKSSYTSNPEPENSKLLLWYCHGIFFVTILLYTCTLY